MASMGINTITILLMLAIKSFSLGIVCVVACLHISFNQKQYTGKFHSMGWEKVSQVAEFS